MATQEAERKLSALGWGLFFMWVAVVLLVKLGPGVGLLGVGAITLITQILRRSKGLALEGFWLVVGFLFLSGGFCDLMAVELPVLPIVLVLAGVVLLASALKGKESAGE